jgi:hypothetical protein
MTSAEASLHLNCLGVLASLVEAVRDARLKRRRSLEGAGITSTILEVSSSNKTTSPRTINRRRFPDRAGNSRSRAGGRG